MIDSANYESNILDGNGQVPEISKEMVEKDPSLEMKFLGERSRE